MDTRARIAKEAERIEEDSLFSAKGHFVAASAWTKLHLTVGVPTAIIAGTASVSALSDFDAHNVVAGVLAMVIAATTALTTFLDPNEKANAHLRSGNKYNSLRNRARIFHEIECAEDLEQQNLQERLTELAAERDSLNEDSLQIPGWAHKRAKKGIEAGEADYLTDKAR